MNQCVPGKMDTKKFDKRIGILEEERVPSKSARGWNI